MFLGSFKTNNEIYQNALAFPTGFDFTVYRDAWIAANFSQALLNSLMITVISVVFNRPDLKPCRVCVFSDGL